MPTKVVLAAAAAVLLAGCSTGPDIPSYGMVPDFQLTDQSGRTFRSTERLDGHPWIANFIFTTCMGPCPRMTSQMKQVRDATADVPNRRLVSFTIDPERDTPPVLAAYGRQWTADPETWYFLTGPMASLHNLSRNVFKLGDIDGTLEHSTRFVLIDAKSRIRGYYDSSDPEAIKQMISDLKSISK